MIQAERPYALWILCVVAFFESTILPIFPDAMLIPMALARRPRALMYGAICTLCSVAGGVLGYYIGYALFEAVGMRILSAYNCVDSFHHLVQHFHKWAFWAITLKGMTPVPYRVVAIAAGVAQVDLATFVIASVLARGMRFITISGLCWIFGDPVRVFIEKYLGWLFGAILLLFLGGFIVLSYL
jgi:membrane protein YqaA with SNARE-associated domain